jgi:hypothetical protein
MHNQISLNYSSKVQQKELDHKLKPKEIKFIPKKKEDKKK